MSSQKKKTSASASASARTRTELRQREREKQARNQRIRIIAIIAAAVVVLAGAVLVLTRTPADAPIPETAANFADLDQLNTEKGYPRVGSIEGVRVSLFSTFGCEECQTFHNDTLPALLDRARAGEISLSFVPLRYGSAIANLNGALRSAICAARQGKFFEYADALYAWSDAYESQAFLDNRLVTGAENLGLDMTLFDECRRSNPETAILNAAQEDAGGRATTLVPPAVAVNDILVESLDIDAINAAIDAAIALRSGATPEPTSDAVAEPTAEPTSEASAEATAAPTTAPTDAPTSEPTAEPTAAPTDEPTAQPTPEPTDGG
ncbi:MAG: thioredoxin domain-containing protein [Chloroflexi bacterium]|nr:thioredoxin domain-containing protein [Chloroflexota bacterium]